MPPIKSLHLPNCLGLARYYHFKGFTEFERFYSKSFPLGTPILKSAVIPFNYLGSLYLDQNQERVTGYAPVIENWKYSVLLLHYTRDMLTTASFIHFFVLHYLLDDFKYFMPPPL